MKMLLNIAIALLFIRAGTYITNHIIYSFIFMLSGFTLMSLKDHWIVVAVCDRFIALAKNDNQGAKNET